MPQAFTHILLTLLLASLGSCNEQDLQGYALCCPSDQMELPKEMREISGLAWWRKDHIAMVQDEKGDLFLYDISRRRIINHSDFGKRGDHEGVASDGEHLFVVRSDGRVYRMEGMSGKEVEHWDSPLKPANDVEGICWDPVRQRLLLACKGEPGAGLDRHTHRSIYAFDPMTGKLDAAPVIVLARDSIAWALKKRGQDQKGIQFAPSAIALHPTTMHFWILSAADRMLVVTDHAGRMIDATHLDPQLFPQPEGLTFDPEGTLYISSEGRKGAGRLLLFQPDAGS